MLVYKQAFGRVISRAFGGFGAGGAAAAAGPATGRVADITWAIFFILVIIISVIFAREVTPIHWAEIYIAAIWGVFVGLTLLFYFHQKIIITVIGAVIGNSTADLTGVGSTIDKIAAGIHVIVTKISASADLTLYPAPGWVFVGLVG